MSGERSHVAWPRAVWLVFVRALGLLVVVARHGLSYALGDRLDRWPRLARRLPPNVAPPERLRIMLEEMGGSFVKLGQMLALQPDIIPLHYCNALFDLLDRIEPFDYPAVERVIVEELGRSPDQLFDSFERTPLSTASIGQVHVAYLDGNKVAVKVQRPTVMAEFGGDIRLMTATMKIIRGLRIVPLYLIVEPLGEFVDWTREELDYRHEARYSEHLAGYAKDNPAQHIPRVYSAYTTRRILVVEFLDGITLLEYLRACETDDPGRVRELEPRGFDRNRFAANVIDNFLGDAFRLGVYHADLHPANLMILENNVVGYVDFGITGVMSRHARRHLVAMTLALARGDLSTLEIEFLKISGFGEDADVAGFRAGLVELSRNWYDAGAVERRLNVNITRVMGDMLTLSRRTGILPERDIVKYIRSAIAIDGLITRFAPGFEVGRYLAESCARLLMWQTRVERFSPERLLDWSSAAGRLAWDGAARVSRLLDRLATGELLNGGNGSLRQLTLRTRAIQLAVSLLGVTLLMVLGHDAGAETIRLGLNLWTAELAFVTAATAMLLGTLRRLSL